MHTTCIHAQALIQTCTHSMQNVQWSMPGSKKKGLFKFIINYQNCNKINFYVQILVAIY